MTKYTKQRSTATVFTLALAFSMTGVAAAQTFSSRTVNIPGGANILVTGVNDSGVLVVNYADSSGTAHCVSIQGATATHIVDPNEVGAGGGTGTNCWGINNSGEIIGSYSLSVFGNGFSYKNGIYTDIIVPGATAGTIAYGINSAGDIVGSYADNVGQHGFVYNANTGSYTTLNVPNAFATLAIGINDSNIITFEWVTSSIVYNGAILNGGHYSILNVPGAMQSKARGINVHNAIVLDAQDTTGVWHGYVYRSGTFTKFDVANSVNTYSFGINSAGVLVGGYNPVATPTGELGFEGRIVQ